MFIFIAFNSFGVLAADDSDVNKINDKTITDVNKVWTIKFKDSVDLNSLANNIQVKDLTTNNILSVSTTIDDDDSYVKINPPSQGYTAGHDYQITITKDVKSKTGINLKRSSVMNFKVIDVTNGNYTVAANVVASPFLPMLKQINISSTNLPNAKKFKIEEGNKMVDIGSAIPAFVGNNSTTVYYYSDNGDLLGKSVLDVSQSNNNIVMKITQ